MAENNNRYTLLVDDVIIQIIKIAEKYPIQKIVLFGSRARGDNSPVSDYDIAVFSNYLSSVDLARFYDEFEEINTLKKIDFVFMHEKLDEKFLEDIKKDGIVIMSKFNIKLNNFNNALQRLIEASAEFEKNPESQIVQDALIQRFEFTYELAWKTTKEYLEDEGIFDKNSPKSVIQEAYAQKLITNEQIWLSMIKDRNMSAHVYDEKMAEEIVSKIIKNYVKEFKSLLSLLQK